MKRIFLLVMALVLLVPQVLATTYPAELNTSPGTITKILFSDEVKISNVVVVSSEGNDTSGIGTHVNPYATPQKAVTVAVSGDVILVGPGTYVGDLVLPDGVSLAGFGLHRTIISGNLTTGATTCDLGQFNFSGTLTISANTNVTNLYSTGQVIVNDDLTAFNFTIENITGPAATINGGVVSLNSGTISSASGTTLVQSGGSLSLDQAQVYNNDATAIAVISTNGSFSLTGGRLMNLAGGQAADLANGAIALLPNALTDVFINGLVDVGSAYTIVDNVRGLGPIQGAGLQWSPSSQIANTSTVSGATLDDALEGIAASAGGTDTTEVEAIIDDYSYNSTEVYTKAETDATIETALNALAASDIANDSIVSGITVSDALDELQSEIGGQGSLFDQMKTFASHAVNQEPDVVLTTEGSGDLQTALNGLSEGDVLEIKTNATYDPVVLSTNEITVIVADGYNPKVSGLYGMTLSDGLENVVVDGITFDGCSTSAQNYKGACITFGTQGSKVSNIIFSNVNFSNVASGSAVMLSYHGFTDFYYADIYESECSDRVGFFDCNFWNAGQELTEGAQLCMRAVKYPYIDGCKLNASTGTARGISLQGVINALIEDNYVTGSTINGGEGIKIDCIGDPQFRHTAVIRNNQVKNCLEGIDADDAADCLIHNNIIWDCIQVGISSDGGSAPKNSYCRMIGNEIYNSLVGIRLESGCSAEVRQNIVYNNGTNYSILNGYALPSDNSTDQADSVLGRTASNTSYDNVTYPNVDEALTYLLSGSAGKSTAEVEAIIDDYSYNSTEVYTKTETDSTIEAYTYDKTTIDNRVLNDLADVNVSAPNDGESLVWNDSASEWTSEAVSMDTSFYRTYYVAPDGNDSTGDGSFSNPWATPGKLWTAIGQPTSAAEYQYRFRAYFAPGEYTLVGTEIVPYRSIQHYVAGCTFTGNITQEIADEYEYGVSSSLFRAVASFHGQAFGNNNHPAKQAGFIIDGNWHLQIESGKTGSTTHDRIVTNTYITGDMSEQAGTGTSVTYLKDVRIAGSVLGSYYFQELDNCRFMGTDFDCSTIIKISDCQFSSDEWGANNTIEITCSSFDSGSSANFVDCYFRKTEFNLAAPKTVYFDPLSYNSYLSGAVSTGSALTAVQRLSVALDEISDVNASSPNDNDVLSWDDGASEWVPVAPSGGSSYLQTVEVWVSDGSASHALAHTPDGQVIVIYENTVWQFPYVNYTVSGNTVSIVGGTTSGDNFLFSYIYH